jgi:hypothetical protein
MHHFTCVVCDLTEVGSAAASYSVGNGPLNVHSWTIGSELMQFDADAYAIARTAETLAEYYTEEVIPPINFFLLSNNASALQAVKNPRSIKAHAAALRFHKALTLLMLRHRQVSYFLVWAPADDSLEGHNMAVEAAKQASWGLPPDGMDRTVSIISEIKSKTEGIPHLGTRVWTRKHVSPNSGSVGQAIRRRTCT